MISILTAMGMIFILFISGHLIECLKRIIMLIVNCALKLLNIFGVHVTSRENRVKVSKDFKNTFKEIKVVKKSNQNLKLKPSINRLALIIFIFSILCIIINLDVVSNGIITNLLYEVSFLNIIVPSPQHMDITFTAIIFSVMSFSASKLLNQWKETKNIRKSKKQIKLRKRVIKFTSSKELLDAAKMKDAEIYEKLKENNEVD